MSLSSDVTLAAWRATSLEPTGIALRFEDVIVQKESARPVYCEHSFVRWSSPLRADADTGDADTDGARARARPVRARMVAATTRRRVTERVTPLMDPSSSMSLR